MLQRGHVVESGLQDDVLLCPRHDYTRVLLAAVPRVAVPDREAPEPRQPPAPVVLEAVRATKTYGGSGLFWRGRSTLALALADVSFQLRRGKRWGW